MKAALSLIFISLLGHSLTAVATSDTTYDVNMHLLLQEQNKTRYEAFRQARKDIEKDIQSERSIINDFLLVLSSAAVAEKDQLGTVFTKDNIEQAFKAYQKDQGYDSEAMLKKHSKKKNPKQIVASPKVDFLEVVDNYRVLFNDSHLTGTSQDLFKKTIVEKFSFQRFEKYLMKNPEGKMTDPTFEMESYKDVQAADTFIARYMPDLYSEHPQLASEEQQSPAVEVVKIKR